MRRDSRRKALRRKHEQGADCAKECNNLTGSPDRRLARSLSDNTFISLRTERLLDNVRPQFLRRKPTSTFDCACEGAGRLVADAERQSLNWQVRLRNEQSLSSCD